MTFSKTIAAGLQKKITQSMLGAHFSVAGGLEQAVLTAKKYHCRALQIFSKNARTWKEKHLHEKEIDRFKQACTKSKVKYSLSHASYLINIASPDPDISRRSFDALKNEISRSGKLGIDYVVLHPGAYTRSSEKKGMETIIRNINQIYNRSKPGAPRLLLETTSGQGTQIGHRFEQLSVILTKVDVPEKTGICLDTCHIFAAGYDISRKAPYENVISDFDQTIGLQKLFAIHLNDSKMECGSRKDRHAHIGKGCIGLEGFRHIMNDKRLYAVPKILETPKIENERDMDQLNLNTLAELIRF